MGGLKQKILAVQFGECSWRFRLCILTWLGFRDGKHNSKNHKFKSKSFITREKKNTKWQNKTELFKSSVFFFWILRLFFLRWRIFVFLRWRILTPYCPQSFMLSPSFTHPLAKSHCWSFPHCPYRPGAVRSAGDQTFMVELWFWGVYEIYYNSWCNWSIHV